MFAINDCNYEVPKTASRDVGALTGSDHKEDDPMDVMHAIMLEHTEDTTRRFLGDSTNRQWAV